MELERFEQEREAKASMTNEDERRRIVLAIEDILSDFTGPDPAEHPGLQNG